MNHNIITNTFFLTRFFKFWQSLMSCCIYLGRTLPRVLGGWRDTHSGHCCGGEGGAGVWGTGKWCGGGKTLAILQSNASNTHLHILRDTHWIKTLKWFTMNSSYCIYLCKNQILGTLLEGQTEGGWLTLNIEPLKGDREFILTRDPLLHKYTQQVGNGAVTEEETNARKSGGIKLTLNTKMFWDLPSKMLTTVTWQGAEGKAGESGQLQSDGTKQSYRVTSAHQISCETVVATFILSFAYLLCHKKWDIKSHN